MASVSLAGILQEIAEEVQNFVYDPVRDQEPVSMQANDKSIVDISYHEEVKKLFYLKIRYMFLSNQYFGILPKGVTEEDVAKVTAKHEMYESLFWNMTRRLSGVYESEISIREGFIVVVPQKEAGKTVELAGGGRAN